MRSNRGMAEKEERSIGMPGFLEAIITGFDAVGHQNLIKLYKFLTGRERGFPLGEFSVISREKQLIQWE